MSDFQTKGLSGKILSKKFEVKKTGVVEDSQATDLLKKREDAKKVAQDKLRAKTLAKQQQISERIATAAEQLSSGIQESSGAAEELNRSMEQIASGAEQASGASEEARAAVTQIEKNAQINANLALETVKKMAELKNLTEESAKRLDSLILGVDKSADSAIETAKMMTDLEKKSEEIGNIVQAVVRIADQTNLLALNAAIEAARAGEHGRGFAVVADEVRTLAETSEKSARQIKDVVGEIQSSVREVVNEVNSIGETAKAESEKGKGITQDLVKIADGMVGLQKISDQTQTGVKDLLDDAKDFLVMSETVASAAEELSSSAEEARKGTEQQTKAFSEMATASQELAETAEELKNSTDLQKSAQELASMAEELSANIEEASSAASELSQAIEQIQKAAEIQAKETTRGAETGEKMAALAKQVEGNAKNMIGQNEDLTKKLVVNKDNIDAFIVKINDSSKKNMQAADNIKILEDNARKIDKIVEAIINVTIQTNMLAVSGSIEAARAGEHGKGFSVVSGDIRSLASESAQNADKIKDMVRDLQIQIQKSLQNVEYSGNSAIAEVERAKISTENLKKIEAEMLYLNGSMNEMLKNAVESMVAIEQGKKGVEQISSAANEASNAVIQATAAAEEQAKGIHELSQAVEEIAALADELQS